MPSPSKKTPAPANRRGGKDERKYYRRGRTKANPLLVTVQVGDQEPFTGEFIDLNVGGASARFPISKHAELPIDQVVQLKIRSPQRREEVSTPARTVYVQEEGAEHVRCGFEFINVGDLHSQINAFYARFFNRRKSIRVLPSLDQRISAVLFWRDESLRASIQNVSATGAAALVPSEASPRLRGVEEVHMQFQLPGSKSLLEGRARIRRRANVGSKMLLGLEFELDRGDGSWANRKQLSEYVLRRSQEIEKWQEAWH